MSDVAQKLKQAQGLINQGRFEQARDLLQRVIRHAPGDRAVNLMMRHTMSRLGQTQQALYYAERALATGPEEPDLVTLHAAAMADCGKLEEAVTRLEPCVARNPGHVLARATLARLYGVQEKLGDCLKTCLPALNAGETDYRLLSVYASALLRIGQADEAVKIMKHIALERARSAGVAGGGDPHQLSALANSMLYDHTARGVDVFAAHHAYGRMLQAELPVQPPRFTQSFDPERKIRLGVVSPDLRDHPSHRFQIAVFERIDRSRFEVYCYSTAPAPNELTPRYRELADHWVEATMFSPHELADRIRADKVDVLLDLAGHTQGNRLLTFHLRPAPVQATWLAYPATTGLAAMDYRIVDSITDPPGMENQSVEKLVRIDPCFVCYRPPEGTPAVDPTPPVSRPGAKGATFVCYNALQKTNGVLFGLWGRILREARGSRLIMRHRATLQADVREHLTQRLTAAGASRDQVLVQPPVSGTVENMAGYNEADVALDTFPYQGMTTTCEALWMGVPVVSLEGQSVNARQGHSILHAAGMGQMLCKTHDEYVALAVSLAADPERLGELRRELRGRIEASPLRDEAGFVRKFEAAVRGMWRERCGGEVHH